MRRQQCPEADHRRKKATPTPRPLQKIDSESDLEGNVVPEDIVEHVYLIEDGLIRSMEMPGLRTVNGIAEIAGNYPSKVSIRPHSMWTIGYCCAVNSVSGTVSGHEHRSPDGGGSWDGDERRSH